MSDELADMYTAGFENGAREPEAKLQDIADAAAKVNLGDIFQRLTPDEAVREYFVEHLGMKLVYKLIVENNQVRRLIHASPGFEELFFLGRLFWLVELAEHEASVIAAASTLRW